MPAINHNLLSLRRKPRRGGYALLLCLFVLSLCAMLSAQMFDTQTSQLAALSNVRDYERANYLANAGAQHALAMLETNASWRGNVSEGTAGADGSYTATAADGTGGNLGKVVVTSSGVAGTITRNLSVTITPQY